MSPPALPPDQPANDGPTTVSGEFEFEIEKIKGSRFIGFACHVDALDRVAEQLERCRGLYPKARHHCWAYRGHTLHDQGYSDDGEPKGSAGPPMAKVLAGKRLVHTLVVVTRFFGGTKLGVGGLVRAYSEATKQVLGRAPVQAFVPHSTVLLRVPFEHTGRAFRVLATLGAETSSEAQAAGLMITAELAEARVATLCDELALLPIVVTKQ